MDVIVENIETEPVTFQVLYVPQLIMYIGAMLHYTSRLLIIAILFALPFSVVAQRRVSHNYTEIRKEQYDLCKEVEYLLLNAQIKKQSGKLVIPIAEKTPKIFKNNNSNENYQVYEYVGDIKETKLSLVKRTGYNSEEFYLVNRLTGTIDTLIGLPVFAQNRKDFACINNPGTDETQQIQIGEVKNGLVNTRVFLNGKASVFLERISCIHRNSLLAKDNTGKYWKLTFKLGDE